MSVPRTVVAFVATVVCGAALLSGTRAFAQGRPDCAEVLRTLHNPKVIGHSGARTPNSVKVAHLLGVDADFVERCAAAFGRRIKRRDAADATHADDAVDLAEKHESEEYDELSREEKETAGDKYTQIIPDDALNRKRLAHARQEDDPYVWEPYEHHAWQPSDERPWQPYMRQDDE